MPDEKFFGQHTIVTEDVTIERDPKAPLLNFRCYERHGMSAYKVDKDADGRYLWDTKRTINKKEDLKPGDEILFEWPFGGMVCVTVDAKVLFAENEGLCVALEFDAGHPEVGIPPEWVGSCFGNKAALTRVAFQ